MVCKFSFVFFSLFLLSAESALKLQGSMALERKVVGGRWQLGFVSESLRLIRIPASASASLNSVLQNIYPVLFVMELLVCDIFSSMLWFCLCLLKTFDCSLTTYTILYFFNMQCWWYSSSAFPSSSYLNFHPLSVAMYLLAFTDVFCPSVHNSLQCLQLRVLLNGCQWPPALSLFDLAASCGFSPKLAEMLMDWKAFLQWEGTYWQTDCL